MLKSTQDLLDHFKLEPNHRDLTYIQAALHVILLIGSKKDADALLTIFLANPTELGLSEVLPAFAKYGDLHYAEQLFEACFKDNRLKDDVTEELLRVLAQLKYEPLKKVLAAYLFEEDGNYFLTKSAVYGMLHFDATEYQLQIAEAIEACYGENLFKEYIPALVSKLPLPEEYLEKLYHLGEHYASTDCNGGLMLGFALSGKAGKYYFMKALKNPNWDATNSGTGTVYATYDGLKYLNICFAELFKDLNTETDTAQKDYLFDCLLELLDCRMKDTEPAGLESFTELQSLLFNANATATLDLIDIATALDRSNDGLTLKYALEHGLKEELMLRNIQGALLG